MMHSCINCCDMSLFYSYHYTLKKLLKWNEIAVKVWHKSHNCLTDIVYCDYAFFRAVGGTQLCLTSQHHCTYNHRK